VVHPFSDRDELIAAIRAHARTGAGGVAARTDFAGVERQRSRGEVGATSAAATERPNGGAAR